MDFVNVLGYNYLFPGKHQRLLIEVIDVFNSPNIAKNRCRDEAVRCLSRVSNIHCRCLCEIFVFVSGFSEPVSNSRPFASKSVYIGYNVMQLITISDCAASNKFYIEMNLHDTKKKMTTLLHCTCIKAIVLMKLRHWQN